MKTTLTLIKADVGSVGGHLLPGKALMETVGGYVYNEKGGLITDAHVSSTGDDIALLLAHSGGVGHEDVHGLAWEAFKAGTEVAKKMGLYGAGQDLLKESFSGNVKGMGPGVAEIEFEERPNEPFCYFAADKTEPGAFNLPLYLTFCDPMQCAGLILSPKMAKGFKFRIMDVAYTEGDRIIELNSPEDIYDIAALLRDNERFVVESVWSREDGSQAAAVSTTRLHNIAGKYVGKDDPVALVRVQGAFPSTGEVLAPYNIGHYVGGFMRGSHTGPLMPCKQNTSVSYFDGPPIVTCAALCVHEGRFSEVADPFDHPYWDWVRSEVARKATDMRRQGFFGAAMLPFSELEYGGIVEKMSSLAEKFRIEE